jgi:hypothetical protein
MSVNPASRSRCSVSATPAKFHTAGCGPRTSSTAAETVAMLPRPPHSATKRPPGRRTAAMCAKSAAWSGIQWKVATLETASASSPSGSAG